MLRQEGPTLPCRGLPVFQGDCFRHRETTFLCPWVPVPRCRTGIRRMSGQDGAVHPKGQQNLRPGSPACERTDPAAHGGSRMELQVAPVRVDADGRPIREQTSGLAAARRSASQAQGATQQGTDVGREPSEARDAAVPGGPDALASAGAGPSSAGAAPPPPPLTAAAVAYSSASPAAAASSGASMAVGLLRPPSSSIASRIRPQSASGTPRGSPSHHGATKPFAYLSSPSSSSFAAAATVSSLSAVGDAGVSTMSLQSSFARQVVTDVLFPSTTSAIRRPAYASLHASSPEKEHSPRGHVRVISSGAIETQMTKEWPSAGDRSGSGQLTPKSGAVRGGLHLPTSGESSLSSSSDAHISAGPALMPGIDASSISSFSFSASSSSSSFSSSSTSSSLFSRVDPSKASRFRRFYNRPPIGPGPALAKRLVPDATAAPVGSGVEDQSPLDPHSTPLSLAASVSVPVPLVDPMLTIVSRKPWLDKATAKLVSLCAFDNQPLPPGDHTGEIQYIQTIVRPRINAMRERKSDMELLDDVRYFAKYGDFLKQRFQRRNYFLRLGIQTQNVQLVTPSEIKKAFRRCSLDWHPDSIRRSGRVLFASEKDFTEFVTVMFQLVEEAYTCLSEDASRLVYLRSLSFAPSASPS